jgi:hypothetical protein
MTKCEGTCSLYMHEDGSPNFIVIILRYLCFGSK